MLSSNALRCIDLLLKEVMKGDQPFGGKVLLLSGDFRQTTNVVPRGSNADVIEACIKCSPLWRYIEVIRLSSNMRSIGQEVFNDWIFQLEMAK